MAEKKHDMSPPSSYSDMKFGKPVREKILKPTKLDAEYANLPAKQKAQYLRDAYYTTS